MHKGIEVIDRISHWSGKTFAWCILLLTAVVGMEVFMRYVMRAPTSWAYDTSYMLYGTLFMMCGAYALSNNAHVRADVLSRYFPPRLHAGLDLVLFLLFFYPGVIALVWNGFDYFATSFRQDEHSSFTPGGPPLYPFKFVIPFAAVLLMLQGVAEIGRCIICLREGNWPARPGDVEELSDVQFKESSQDEEIQP
ncbi:TRAP transporter small permease subunit [Aidingimonas halophila]|uniref:TRAP transporter small permease protein n=1 Tax=Aidingimonas halophila TaxID=574349 RepID=A0A1H2SER6_9GAMM|nr:TRAP transporter small permease subunit [Aidingimonas halophila]GHC17753.1 membrane protein [Aidingimonas halophila]SDW30017.1 TRAP-type mannitol/chloroaromatic compound transport system, small permease component [Aidingimonas halophila]